MNILSWKLGTCRRQLCVLNSGFQVLPLSNQTLSAKCCGLRNCLAYPFTLKQFYGLFSLSFFSFAFKFLVKKKKWIPLWDFGLFVVVTDHEKKNFVFPEYVFLLSFHIHFMMLRKLLYIPSLLSGFMYFCYEKVLNFVKMFFLHQSR